MCIFNIFFIKYCQVSVNDSRLLCTIMDHCEVMIIVPVGTPILIMFNIRSHYPSLLMLNEGLKDCNLFSFLQLILIFQLDFNNLIHLVHLDV